MRLTELAAEAGRSAWASKVPTVLVALLVAAMCATTGVTVGRAAAAQAQIAARLDDAGSRHLTVIDARGTDLVDHDVVRHVAGLSVVERAIGLTSAIDVLNTAIGAGGTRVPAWQVSGTLADAVTLTAGRWPDPGEALISAGARAALGLTHPAGAVTPTAGGALADTTFAVVGEFAARAPFENLDTGVIVHALGDAALTRLEVIATDASTAAHAQHAALTVIGPADPGALTVRSPLTLAQVTDEVLGDLADFNRSLTLLVLAAGACLVAAVTLGDVLMRRTELGRRRALGAPRWALIGLVTTRSTLSGAAGALIGSAAAIAVLHRDGYTPDLRFALGTAVLALTATTLATVPPALLAAHQDPVRVLRTP